jgi:hypothetical protein
MRALTPLEARVLGVLVEKQHTVPDTYPLSLNSLVAGVNQKTARDPVINATEAEVLTEVLGARGWVKPEPATEKDVDIEFCGIPLTSFPINSRTDFRTGFRAAERLWDQEKGEAVSDNLTLPRVDALQIREALVSGMKRFAALTALAAAMDAPATPAAAAVDASTAPVMQCAYPHCCDKAGNRCPRMFAGQCSGPRAADPQQVGR